MQPSNHRFFVSGQVAARAKNSLDTERYNQERNWLKTALAMEHRDVRADAERAYNKGFDSSRQISGGMYL